jgi:predicted ArsR family transcriptional regulator
MTRGVQRGWPAVEALSEPTRRRVYEAVRDERAPLTRNDVAAAAGIGRPIAAFHLDALAKAGLLEVDYARPPGRRGPGAGRPSKRYRVAHSDIALNVPERRYDLAGQILAAGVRDAGTGDARTATFEAAHSQGRELAEEYAGRGPERDQLDRACAILGDLGYEPVDDTEADVVRLRNCPFHAVVDVEPELVCHMNLRLLEGLIEGLGFDELTARFAPTSGECCVHITEAGR